MDSDSDSPFNYSWPSFPKMRMRKKMGKKGDTESFCARSLWEIQKYGRTGAQSCITEFYFVFIACLNSQQSHFNFTDVLLIRLQRSTDISQNVRNRG